MNYIGSKYKLSPFLKESIHGVIGDKLEDKVFCDIFAGTGAVARSFKTQVKSVISNDLEFYSFVLNKNYIDNHQTIKNSQTYIDKLNALPLKLGFIYQNYCLGGGTGRQYFSDENGQKIDTIRQKITQWKKSKKIKGDILYLDPPYNARQYGANYHLLNTIAKYDEFTPKGKTGLRDYNRSDYCKKSTVKQSFEHLIKHADFKTIFLSYNNEGLMSVDEVKQIMSKYGKYDLASTKYQRFKADKTQNRQHKATLTTEFLHILEK